MILEWRTDNPPEEICTYLITDDMGYLQIAEWTNIYYFGQRYEGKWRWKCRQYSTVVAWLPLPKPYKELIS